jgi:hypothetical protein
MTNEYATVGYESGEKRRYCFRIVFVLSAIVCYQSEST